MVDRLFIAGCGTLAIFSTGFILLFVAIGGEVERKASNTASTDSCLVLDCYILNSGSGVLSGTTTGWTVYLQTYESIQSITGACPGNYAVNGTYTCYYCPDCYGAALARWQPIQAPESQTQQLLWWLSGIFLVLPCVVGGVTLLLLHTCIPGWTQAKLTL